MDARILAVAVSLVLGTSSLIPARAQSLPLEIKVDLADGRAVPYTPAVVKVVVRNPLQEPVALLGLQASSSGTSFLEESLATPLPASLGDTGAEVDGTLFVEAIGPQARLPAPPRWEWKGASSLTTFPVLLPGRSLSFRGAFVPTEACEWVEVQVRYAFVPRDWLLRLGQSSLEAAEPGAGTGWVENARLTATFRQARQLGRMPESAVKWKSSELLETESLPRTFPLGVDSARFARLEKSVSQVRLAIPLLRPALPLAAARARAKVPSGAQAYANFGGIVAWALESADSTVLIGPGQIEVLPGKLVELVLALNAGDGVEVDLFSRASERDPDGIIGFLENKGFRASSSQEKGGGWRGSVKMKRAEFRKLCKALQERGLKIEGRRVVREED